jgi:hypothetical protein
VHTAAVMMIAEAAKAQATSLYEMDVLMCPALTEPEFQGTSGKSTALK